LYVCRLRDVLDWECRVSGEGGCVVGCGD
jgi:hypothetical protein